MPTKVSGPFSPENIAKAIQRVPASSTKQVKAWLKLAREKGLTDVAEACEAEIAIRPIEFDSDSAHRHVRTEQQTAGMELQERIEFAFTDFPASPAEVRMARIIASRPGITFTELNAAMGKGDSGLVIGHFVYDRFGCFRALISPGEPQSNVLFTRTQTQSGVCYVIKSEAEAAFKKLEIL